MKSIKQMLGHIFFNIDFTNAIADGIKDYNQLCGYTLKGQVSSQIADDKKANSAACLHQQLTINVTDSLKVAG